MQSRKQFLNRQIFERCEKFVRIAITIITFFLTVDLCLKPYRWVTPKTQEKEFRFYLYLLWSYSSNKVKRVNSIVTCRVAPFDAMQKIWWFLTSWCQELSDCILHEWFRSDNFQLLLYLKTISYVYNFHVPGPMVSQLLVLQTCGQQGSWCHKVY